MKWTDLLLPLSNSHRRNHRRKKVAPSAATIHPRMAAGTFRLQRVSFLSPAEHDRRVRQQWARLHRSKELPDSPGKSTNATAAPLPPQLPRFCLELPRNPFLPPPPAASSRSDPLLSPLHQAVIDGEESLAKQYISIFSPDTRDAAGRTPLIYAVLTEDVYMIHLLCAHQANPDLADNEGRTPCHFAAYYGRIDLLTALLKYGANWRLRDKQGRSTLHWAVGQQSLECLQRLLNECHRVDLQEPDDESMTSLHWAAYHNHPKHMKLLLKRGKSSSEKNEPVKLHHQQVVVSRDVEGKTPLHWCANHKDLACAKLLLKANPACISITDYDGRTALHLACVDNNLPLAQLLLKHNASPDVKDVYARTALHWAAVLGWHAILQLLLEFHAKDSQADKMGATPLHYACAKNHAQCVSVLTKPQHFANLPDNHQRHPLVWAVMKGHLQSVRVLLDRGVSVQERDEQGATVLHMATLAGQTRCVTMLLEAGAYVDAVDRQQHTPLFRAVERGHVDTANVLVQASANVNHRDIEGRTCLHWAALNGYLPVLSMLIANRADLEIRDKLQRHPLHYAAYNAHNELIKYMLECGADVDVRDSDHLTPLHWAAAHGHITTVELFLRQGCLVNPSDAKLELMTPLEYAKLENYEECVDLLLQFGGATVAVLRSDAARIIQRVWKGFHLRRKQRKASVVHKIQVEVTAASNENLGAPTAPSTNVITVVPGNNSTLNSEENFPASVTELPAWTSISTTATSQVNSSLQEASSAEGGASLMSQEQPTAHPPLEEQDLATLTMGSEEINFLANLQHQQK